MQDGFFWKIRRRLLFRTAETVRTLFWPEGMEEAVSERGMLLARTLKQGIIDSVIMVNWTEEHCALAFGNGLYDVTGRISAAGFHAADENEIRFMEKNYRPGFDTEKLEKYLAEK